jgi:hypothetical protein
MIEDRFLTPLRTEKIGPYRWILLDDFHFQTKRLNGILVTPRGFQTDLASIPLRLGSIIPRVGAWDWPSIPHDAGYGNSLVTINGERIHLIKELCDLIFYDGLICVGVRENLARTMYDAVRLFGDHQGHPLAKHGGEQNVSIIESAGITFTSIPFPNERPARA